MTVVDTSAWIEYFRRTGSPVHRTLRRLVHDEAEIVLTEVVVMELLAGSPTERHADGLRETLLRFPVLRLHGLASYEEAARLYRTCRRGGTTIRGMTDCLIAVAAIEVDAPILHNDRDFDAIAAHSPLRVHPVDDTSR